MEGRCHDEDAGRNKDLGAEFSPAGAKGWVEVLSASEQRGCAMVEFYPTIGQ